MMIKSLLKDFIKSVLISICIIAQLNWAMAQTTTASLLPNAVQQFFDNNGNPLTGGKVYTYLPGTLTFATTWQNSTETIANANPIVLDAGGKAIIYGNQTYRQIVKDRNGNLIWDAVTAPGGGSSSPTLIGDGRPVGTIEAWGGLVVPNQYAYAYGQQLSRVTFPELLAAITQQLNVACTTGSNTFTAISDTTQINPGSPIELICVAPGTTVVSKTSSSVVLSNPSTLTINTPATFFPFGNGDGSTTFTVPDLRGYVVAGRTNMGGTASTNLTQTYFGTISPSTVTPAALGAVGGNQSNTLAVNNLPSITPVGTVSSVVTGAVLGGNSSSGATGAGGAVGAAANIVVTSTFIGTPLAGAGDVSFARIQPTVVLNYIIKTTPDTPASSVTGVSSLGGMQGIIACGSGINCSANTISANGQVAAGVNTNIQFNDALSFGGATNFNYISPNTVELGAAGVSAAFNIYGLTSGKVTQTVRAIAGTPSITWGNTSGTPAVINTLPISLDTITGTVSCPTCATATLNAAALTRTNDTNVTLTLGGTPNTSLLNATSLTLGWTGTLAAARLNSNVVQSISNDTNVTGTISAQNLTLAWSGQLALSRGGTNASLTADNGGIVYSNASGLAILAHTTTANLPLLSANATTPAWASVAYFTNAGISGGVPYFSSTTQISSSALLAANQIMVGGGAGVAPTTFACATTTTVVHGGTPPTCSQIVAGDITTNTITNSNLSQVGAATFKGNPTSSTANAQDFTIQGLTARGAPDATNDKIPLFDNAAGTIKYVTPAQIASSATAGVSSLNSLTGALTLGVSAGLNITSGGTTITISPDVATAANFEAGTANKILDAAGVFTSETTTTFGTTTAFDANTFINTKVTLTGNITTMNCSNFKPGQAGTIAFIQDSTGSRTATFGTGTCSTTFRYVGATNPTLTTSASAVDILSYSCRTSTNCAAALSKGYNP